MQRNAVIASMLILGCCHSVTAAPDPSNTSPISANVSVDWNTVVGTTTAATFSTNDQTCTNPTYGSGSSAYATNLSNMGIKFFRLHCGSLTDDWSNSSTQSWNVNAITAEYNAPYLQGATIIQNIPSPPSWLRNGDGSVSNVAAYAAYCAQLVNIVNNQLHKHVVYWEPMNEWDDIYANNWTQACAIYNQCATAMKQQDPSIKVGGPALKWGNQGLIQTFLQQCAPNVDFISYHSYYSSGTTQSNDSLMATASSMDQDVTNTRNSINQYGQGRSIQVMLDEYNISGDYTTGETRQYTNVGAVYFATTIKHDAYAGAYACSVWSAKDGYYGLTDLNDSVRLPAYLFQWANRNLIGSLVNTGTSNSMVEAMAVSQNGARSIMVMNKASGTATINLASNIASSTVQYCTLTASGMSAPQTMSTSGLASFAMQPLSLLFVSATAGGPIANGTYTLISACQAGCRLDAWGAGTTNGTGVGIYTSNGGANQKWVLTLTNAPNTYSIRNANTSNEVLDADAASTANGTKVQLWQDFGSANQRWNITQLSNGKFKISPSYSSSVVLDVNGGTNGTNVQLWQDYTGSNDLNQMWSFSTGN